MVGQKSERSTWADQAVAPTLDQYSRWLSAIHDVSMEREKVRYESAVPKLVSAAAESAFWLEYQGQRRELAQVYELDTGFKLYVFEKDDVPQAKSWDSLVLKSFRRNVLDNKNWPAAPEGGWLLPANWITSVHDLVRTSIVVKYLDGVKFLTQAFHDIASVANVEHRSDLEARDTGYYAAHTYSAFGVDLPDITWVYKAHSVQLEVQITTQLQEVIGKLTHREYERRRVRPASDSKGWQWDHASQEFHPNYLGHLLHYAEGMIMEVRDRDKS